MNTLEKIQKAIELIKSKNLKKLGKNKFSNYDYYTPEQVAELVTGATHEVKLLCKFDLKRNELGITGTLSVYDVESSEQPVVYEMATAIPDIKATNIAQQIGGAMTYTKRYLMMNAFDIVDNNLDFDTTENTQKQAEQPKVDPLVIESIKKAIAGCKSQEDLKKMWGANAELQKENWFIKLVTDRKKVLTDNGIE
jgi:TATA-box binding protein (TBP) (component of TFIID and TFIIIB)